MRSDHLAPHRGFTFKALRAPGKFRKKICETLSQPKSSPPADDVGVRIFMFAATLRRREVTRSVACTGRVVLQCHVPCK